MEERGDEGMREQGRGKWEMSDHREAEHAGVDRFGSG